MKKIITLLLTAIMLFTLTSCRNDIPESKPIIDELTEEEEIEPMKETASDVFEDVDEINKTVEIELSIPNFNHGEWSEYYSVAVPFIYDMVLNSLDGYTLAIIGTWSEGLYALYDGKGNEIVSPKYNDIGISAYTGFNEIFFEDLARVNIGGFKDTRTYGGKWGFIDRTGKEVIPIKYDYADSFYDGMAIIGFGDDNAGIGEIATPVSRRWGFIDKSGNEVIAAKYDRVYRFTEGLAAVMIGDNETGKWGFIDKTGKEIVQPKYDEVHLFSEGLAAVRVGDDETGKMGFIDKNGIEIVPPIYDAVKCFSEGTAQVKLNGKLGLIDKTGREVMPLRKYKYVALQTAKDTIAVMFDDKWCYINKSTGKEIVTIYDNLYSFSEGLAAVRFNGKSGFMDKTGKEIVTPKYDEVYAFSNGFAAVSIDDKWGFVDKNGKEVVPLLYDFEIDHHDGVMLTKFSEGFAAVRIGDYETGFKYGFIDETGGEVIPLKYDYANNFFEGLAAVSIDGKWGFIDKTGKEVVPFIFDHAMDFSNGLAWVKIGNNETGKWGLISIWK